MNTCPVVKIVSAQHPGGFFEINESDFDVKIHTIFDPKKVKVKPVEKPAC